MKRAFDPDGILNPGVKVPLAGPEADRRRQVRSRCSLLSAAARLAASGDSISIADESERTSTSRRLSLDSAGRASSLSAPASMFYTSPASPFSRGPSFAEPDASSRELARREHRRRAARRVRRPALLHEPAQSGEPRRRASTSRTSRSRDTAACSSTRTTRCSSRE